MIDRLIDASARHRVLVLIAATAAAIAGLRSMTRLPLDALPDVGERQIVVQSRWDRSPDLVDAQVTSPVVSALLGAPGVKAVRGLSDAGGSLVTVTFDEDVDLVLARTRTLELLAGLGPRLPDGVKPQLGPEATSLGWVFQYVLVDRSGRQTPADLRAYQDWYLRDVLREVRGVADVAAVGGFVRQFDVIVDPARLRAYGVSVPQIVDGVRQGNRDVSGPVVTSAGAQIVVRGLGTAASMADLEQIVVGSTPGGRPVTVADVARVTAGAGPRQGVTDLDGRGDVVSGIVVMRDGQNALEVIDRVKARLAEVAPSLPAGVEIVPVYDRSDLVRRSVRYLTWTIVEVAMTVSIIVLLFLTHLPSAAVPLVALPAAVLITFVPMAALGVGLNLMSLAGIAIAIGALVDAGIVVAEQAHFQQEVWARGDRREPVEEVLRRAIRQVARPAFLALVVIAVSFLPVLAFEGEEGRLFRPLAYAKSLTMLVGALLAVTLVPAVRLLFTRTRPFRFGPAGLSRAANALLVDIRPQMHHPLNGRIVRWYEPVVRWSIRRRTVVWGAAAVVVAVSIPIWPALGTELMPPFDEGSLLYMPSTAPGISPVEAARLLESTDRALMEFPEVERVLGKAGRADTATDPAPLSMLETLIVLRPVSEWRRVPTWYSRWAPEWSRPFFRRLTPDHLTREALIAELNARLTLPGVANAWSMPIRGRLDMLTTGVRTPLGMTIAGPRADETERLALGVADALAALPGTRSAFAERAGQGRFLDVVWNRRALSQAGIGLDAAQSAIATATTGQPATEIVRGRERYVVNVRHAGSPSDPESLVRIPVAAADARVQVPIGRLADVRSTVGPWMVRNERGQPASYVHVDLAGGDLERYRAEADRVLRSSVALPPGYTMSWSGRYEEIARTRRQLAWIVPLALAIVAALVYASTRSLPGMLLVMLAVPFSAVGAIWTLWALGYHVSLAVWVGVIALMGVDAETGVFMVLYLDEACDRRRREGQLETRGDLELAVLEGAARRVRPKLMTATAMLAGLLPVLVSTGTGADVMKRIAAPMAGGISTSFVLELLVYPAIYYAWKSRALPRSAAAAEDVLARRGAAPADVAPAGIASTIFRA